MFVNPGKTKSQQGFSLAEVMVATVLFIAAILGVSLMLISGGTNVTIGAKESAASNLAEKKIEEVKSLPFYLPWDGTPKDIDDFYWAYDGATPRPNSAQAANPVVEDYGTIPGYAAYKRTTSVCYQYVSGSSLANAVMDPNWRPKAPGSGQFDRPMGGPAGGPYDVLRALMIQVKVFYRTDLGEKSYTAQGLAGDLMITGGTNNPMMVINSIQPTSGFYGTDTSLEVKIYVSTPPNTLNASSQLGAYLWYPGHSDIQALNTPAPPRANAAGTEITCYFNLGTASVRPGYYNLAVYWKERGWLAVFRDNVFEVRALPPTVTGISTHNWGYARQTARQITITGANLWNPVINLKGPHPANTYTIPGAVQTTNGTTCTVNFNLTGTTAQRPADSRWNLDVTTAGGTVNTNGDGTNARRFWLNPPPTITQVTPTAPGTYYDWTYLAQTTRRVMVEGTYLYGMNEADTGSTLLFEPYETARATFVSGATGNACVSSTALVMDYNPNSSSAPVDGTTRNSRWKVKITNYGGTVQSTAANSQRVWMNPPPVVTARAGFPGTATTGTATPSGGGTKSPTSSRTYTGLSLSNGGSEAYIQDNAKAYLVKGSSVDPETNSSTVYANLGQSVTPIVSADGRTISGLNMRVHVNPTNLSFMRWSGAAVSNEEVAGTYHVFFKNADGQSCPTGLTVAVTHAQYVVSADVTPSGWGSVAFNPSQPAGGFYQDTAYTITPSHINPYAFRVWQEPVGTDQWGYSWQLSGNATAARSVRCRSLKKLFWGPDGASANWAGFHLGYTDSPYSGPDYAYADTSDGTPVVMRLWAGSSAGLFSSDDGEVGSETNVYDCSGASTLWVRWRQPNGDGDGISNWGTLSASTTHNGRYNSGQRLGRDNPFGWQWESTSCSGWNQYIRVSAYSDAYAPYFSGTTDLRVSYMFIE